MPTLTTDQPVPAKKVRTTVTEYEDVEEAADVVEMDEVTRYLQISTRPAMNQDILAWWKDQSELPKLQALARQILAIPASSAASERSFSAAGCTVSARRSALSSSNVDDILFIHSNKFK